MYYFIGLLSVFGSGSSSNDSSPSISSSLEGKATVGIWPTTLTLFPNDFCESWQLSSFLTASFFSCFLFVNWFIGAWDFFSWFLKYSNLLLKSGDSYRFYWSMSSCLRSYILSESFFRHYPLLSLRSGDLYNRGPKLTKSSLLNDSLSGIR